MVRVSFLLKSAKIGVGIAVFEVGGRTYHVTTDIWRAFVGRATAELPVELLDDMIDEMNVISTVKQPAIGKLQAAV
ncbi:hypothetical protein [Evansella halocellulosilytica]|uniref:hypothetical protein n=1 Tax=Evansella halocellulosilytica TaxID=2011013 RepID=UPI000BB6B9D9|nr:hypothetical protein [Evansella halocellulosilytica]